MKINRVLAETSEALSMPFLDMTEAFRTEGRGRVLHYAPVDYHANARGNEVAGNAIFEFLVTHGLVQ